MAGKRSGAKPRPASSDPTGKARVCCGSRTGAGATAAALVREPGSIGDALDYEVDLDAEGIAGDLEDSEAVSVFAEDTSTRWRAVVSPANEKRVGRPRKQDGKPRSSSNSTAFTTALLFISRVMGRFPLRAHGSAFGCRGVW